MDLSESADERAFREQVRTFAEGALPSDIRNRVLSFMRVPRSDYVRWQKILHEQGWGAPGWPREYGGTGWNAMQRVVFEEECFRAGAPRQMPFGLSMVGPVLIAFGTAEQRARYLPRILTLEEWWCQGYSEPGAGSDLASLRTKAVRDGDEWVIDGQKIWTSAGIHADWLYVLCRTNPTAPRHKGISMLLVPAGQPGVEIRVIRNILGTSEFCEVFFSGARTAADLVVGEVDGGWSVAMGALGTERGTTLLAEHLRIQHEITRIVNYARETQQLDSAVMRAELARAWSQARIIEWNGRRLMSALKKDESRVAAQASISKVFASSAHRRIGELAMRAMGPASELVGDDYELDRLQQVLLASRAESIYGGTTQIQLNLLAERTLGLPREPKPGANA